MLELIPAGQNGVDGCLLKAGIEREPACVGGTADHRLAGNGSIREAGINAAQGHVGIGALNTHGQSIKGEIVVAKRCVGGELESVILAPGVFACGGSKNVASKTKRRR